LPDTGSDRETLLASPAFPRIFPRILGEDILACSLRDRARIDKRKADIRMRDSMLRERLKDK